MGIEDREWYREKQIDWERGGLKDRNAGRPRGRSRYLSWVLAAITVIAAVALYRSFL